MIFFGSQTELLPFGPAPWEAVIRGPAVGETPWGLSHEPKEQEEDLGLAQPYCTFVSLGSKNLDSFPDLFALSEWQRPNLWPKEFLKAEFSKISVIHSCPPLQFSLHLHTTWKHVYWVFPALSKSLKYLNYIGSLLAQKTPVTSHLRVNSRALTTGYKDPWILLWPHFCHSFSPLQPFWPPCIPRIFQTSCCLGALAQSAQNTSLLMIISQKGLSWLPCIWQQPSLLFQIHFRIS